MLSHLKDVTLERTAKYPLQDRTLHHGPRLHRSHETQGYPHRQQHWDNHPASQKSITSTTSRTRLMASNELKEIRELLTTICTRLM
ncbi:hypothetical protein FKM82_025908 [Ascaphus truei]